jgi:hypothetical protein
MTVPHLLDPMQDEIHKAAAMELKWKTYLYRLEGGQGD